MAKKKSTSKEFSVEDKLHALHKLQSIDSEIDKIRTVRGELPLEVQDLEDELKGVETRIEKIDSDIADKENNITKRKLAIKESEELVKKYNEQLNNIKNNREYDSLSKEIEFQNLEIELANKKIKDNLAKIELLKVTKTESTEILNERKEIFEEKKVELASIVSETEKDEEKLLEQSKKAEKVVDDRLLSAYKRIRKAQEMA